MNERVFKALKLTVPEDVIVVELSLSEFQRLASKQDFTPIFENNEGLFHIDSETRIMFCAKKEERSE